MDQRRLSACVNFVGFTDAMGYIKQPNIDQRRLSDGPSLGIPNYNHFRSDEFGSNEFFALKQRNSSLNTLLDSTSSMMRTASTTFQNLFGSVRRASYCGEPDPTIQLSPRGDSGSLYLVPTAAHSNESSLSNASYEEQRRTVTIYDGRIPAASTTPSIPFDLMAPVDAITQTIEDPIESFVQIILEEPDDRPVIIQPPPISCRNSSSRNRHRPSSRKSSLTNGPLPIQEKELNHMETSSVTDIFNALEVYYRAPDTIEPMDFSFLEPVLRGESAAPPPIRNQTKTLIPSENEIPNDHSTIKVHSPLHKIDIITVDSQSRNILNNTEDDSYSSANSIASSRLQVPSSID